MELIEVADNGYGVEPENYQGLSLFSVVLVAKVNSCNFFFSS
jgi:hypothetical protein